MTKKSVCFALALFAIPSHATTKIAVSEIPDLLNTPADNPAPYNHLLNELDDVDILFAPPPRVELMFTNKDIDCLFPGSKGSMDGNEKLLESMPVQSIRAYFFSKNEYETPAHFKGRNIGLRRGFSYGKIRERFEANFIELSSNESAFEMLNKNRVDAVVAYLPDALAIQEKASLNDAYYNPDVPIHVTKDAFVCHPKAGEFVAGLNIKLQQWSDTGQLRAWLLKSSGDLISSPENAEQP